MFERIALYTAPYGLYADAENLGGLRHGQTLASGCRLVARPVVTHAPMLDHYDRGRKPLEAILVAPRTQREGPEQCELLKSRLRPLNEAPGQRDAARKRSGLGSIKVAERGG
jgi:hypothetical protein